MAVGFQPKPFGIQSPEQVAKIYGGNKQRIAEAMQLGIVDPTIGTLAGMFIDRMAAGAAQGQAPQGTVASQVFDLQTPAAQAPGGAGPGGLPPVPGAPPMGPPPPDMSMGMGAPPPDMSMGMGAPPPDMPMPPPSPEAMQPMSPGMADGGMVAFRSGGSSDDYRLPPMREERHNNLLELVRQFTGINQRVGDANVHGQYDPIRNTSDYRVDVPVAGGNFSTGAYASRGVRPDSFSADYSHRLLGGNFNVGARHDRGGTSGHVGFRKDFADGGMVAFARGGESRPLDLQSLLPFPEAGLPKSAGFADGGVASLPVPDDMFNSSVGDIQQYADGGMVAFAGAGEVAPRGPWFEQQALEAVPGIRVTSRERSAAHNAQVGGVPNSYHLTNNARDFAPPKGMSMATLHDTLKRQMGAGYDVINEGDHIHVEPGNRRAVLAAAPKATAAPDVPTATPAGLAAAAQTGPNEETRAMYDLMQGEATQRNKDRAADKKDRRQAAFAALAQRGLAMLSPEGAGMPSLFADGGVVRFAAGTPPNDPYSLANQQAEMAKQEQLAPPNHEFYNMRMASIREDLANERTDRKQAANMALMNFGLALMASKNPNFLGAVGESGAPAVAGMKADLRDLKKEARATIMDAAQLEDYDNKGRRGLADAATAHINRVVDAQTQASQFELKEQNDTIRSREQIAAQRDIAAIGERGATARAAAALEAARIKTPYELETKTLKDDNGDERLVQIRTNKNTGEVHQYSPQIGDYLKPEYALAMNKPGVKERLDVLLSQVKGAMHVGADGRMYLQRGNSPGMNPIKPSWLESLATSPDANK